MSILLSYGFINHIGYNYIEIQLNKICVILLVHDKIQKAQLVSVLRPKNVGEV